jgi:hypothetical protein
MSDGVSNGTDNSRRGSILLEGALWTFLITLTLVVLGKKFIKSYRGFQRAVAHQRSMLDT